MAYTEHDHHESHAAAEASSAASWMVALAAFFVLALALVVTLFVWAPWDDDNSSTAPGGGDVPAEGADENINIEGDIDINGGDEPSQ